MPYIRDERRIELDSGGMYMPATAGELNYRITMMVRSYWLRQPTAGYQAINDIIGALESAKAEFQRRIVAPYEDKKIQENGDVY